jgi:hypothetical protein
MIGVDHPPLNPSSSLGILRLASSFLTTSGITITELFHNQTHPKLYRATSKRDLDMVLNTYCAIKLLNFEGVRFIDISGGDAS